MAVLVFATKLDNEQLTAVQRLIGDAPVTGIGFTVFSGTAEANGSLDRLDVASIGDALFSTTRYKSISYTFIESDIDQRMTVMLVLDERLKYLGLLNEDAVAHGASIVEQLFDRKILETVAQDIFMYAKMPDGDRIRDKELGAIKSDEIRTRAMAKGCGKKCLLDLAAEVQTYIDTVELIKHTH